MESILRLPPHRYRLNTLLGRELGETSAYRRVRDQLWADGEVSAQRIDLPFRERGPTAFALSVARAAPPRAACRIRLTVGPERAMSALRFEAQKMTLEGAVEASPSLWGAAVHVEAALDDLAPGERRGLVLSALRQFAAGQSMLDPWCQGASLLLAGLEDAPGRAFMKVHPLRALRGAGQEGLIGRVDLDALVIQAALQGLGGTRGARRQRGDQGPLNLVIAGRGALSLAGALSLDPGLRVVRAADDSTLYTPAAAIERRAPHEMVPTGPYDPGVLSEPADAIVLLPGLAPVDREAAESLGARIVLESRVGLILPEADATLSGRRIEVVPDLLFAAVRPMACDILRRPLKSRVAALRERLAIDVAQLVRETQHTAAQSGRSLRDQVYLRALGNLQR